MSKKTLETLGDAIEILDKGKEGLRLSRTTWGDCEVSLLGTIETEGLLGA